MKPLYVDISDFEEKLDEIIEIKDLALDSAGKIQTALNLFHGSYTNQLQKSLNEVLEVIKNFPEGFERYEQMNKAYSESLEKNTKLRSEIQKQRWIIKKLEKNQNES